MAAVKKVGPKSQKVAKLDFFLAASSDVAQAQNVGQRCWLSIYSFYSVIRRSRADYSMRVDIALYPISQNCSS